MTKEYTVSCTQCGKDIKAKAGEQFQCCGPMVIKEKGECTCGESGLCTVHEK